MALKVFEDGTDTYVAENLDDLRKLVEERLGCTLEMEGRSIDDFEECPPDKVIRIHDIEGDLRERGFVAEETPLGHSVVARTAAEWIASEGRGLLCSTEY